MERGWLARLRGGGIVLIDGGTGGELARRGVGMSPLVWSGLAARDSASTLRAVHADFVRAGAEVVTTNTFGTTRFVLERAGLGGEFAAINRRAVAAAVSAREAAAGRPIAIAGSMSCLPPGFDAAAYPPAAVERDAYLELALLLAEAGVDAIALEMIQDAEHGRLAMAAALETGLPVWLGISARRADGRLVAYDYPERRIEPVLEALAVLGPAVVNVMHTPVEAVDAALACVKRHWRGPIGVYPELERGVPPETLVEHAVRWVRSGARLLGGCCGAGPDHVAALAAARPRLEAARDQPSAPARDRDATL